jgi:hypothetical protein
MKMTIQEENKKLQEESELDFNVVKVHLSSLEQEGIIYFNKLFPLPSLTATCNNP